MQFRVRLVVLEPLSSNATPLPAISSIWPGASLVRVEGSETAAARATLVPPDAPGAGFGLDIASPLAGASTMISFTSSISQADVERLVATLVRARATTLLIDLPAGTTARAVRDTGRRALDTRLRDLGRLLVDTTAESVPARAGSGLGVFLGLLGLLGVGYYITKD
jgi:hypothetical protein